MSSWVLVPSLVALRGEINDIAPLRDKVSDGSVGDTAHAAAGNSDHLPDEDFEALRDHDTDSKNEVHAIDVDKDLRVPGLTMQRIVKYLVGRCRAGLEKRLTYIIYDGVIYSPATGWRDSGRPYTSGNPHDKHAHFSASYSTAREADTSPYGLESLMPPITDDEIERIAARVEQRVWNHTEPNPYDNGATTRRMGGDMRMMEYRDDNRALATNVTRLDQQVIPALQRIEPLVVAIAARDDVDEEALAAAVLAGLTTDRLAAAITAAGLTPETIADAIPEQIAEDVVDALNRRLAE